MAESAAEPIEPEPQAPPVDAAVDATVAAAGIVPGGVASAGIASAGIVPGAYLPPTPVHRGPPVGDGGGYRSPTWPARPDASPWPRPAPTGGPGIGDAGGGGMAASTATPAAAAPVTSPGIDRAQGGPSDASTLTPGRASILADLPFDAPDRLEGWLVALGAGLGVISFFLPWRDALGTGLDGYLGSWGLGITAQLPFFLLIVVVTALALLPNRVATWVRTGVLGILSGGFLFGLVWLYLGGGTSQLGALLAAVGAVLLIVGGVLAVAPGRADRSGDGE